MIDLFLKVFEMLDPILIFWALVLNVLGFYLKRIGTPRWCPPIPLLLFLVACVPCFALGWATAPVEGARAALYALIYGVSNGALITLPAIFGYDVVHAFTGRYATKREYKLAWDDGLDPMKKLTVYGTTALVTVLAAGSIAFFCFHETVFYSICWAAFFGALSVVIARTVVHIVCKQADAEMYAVSIYSLAACGAWLGLILCTSWLWVSLWGAALVGCTIAALGTRFLDPLEEGEVKASKKEEAKEAAESDQDFLSRTLRWRLTDDRMGGAPDPDRALCEVDGKAMTVVEADAAGFGAIAAEGLEYIKELLREEEI